MLTMLVLHARPRRSFFSPVRHARFLRMLALLIPPITHLFPPPPSLRATSVSLSFSLPEEYETLVIVRNKLKIQEKIV